ncbi:MAG: hypothetical protein WBF17_17880, partial [Phycisphaerae bacterium]
RPRPLAITHAPGRGPARQKLSQRDIICVQPWQGPLPAASRLHFAVDQATTSAEIDIIIHAGGSGGAA